MPAEEIEKFVVERIKAIGKDPAVLAETLRQARAQAEQAVTFLQGEERAVKRELVRHHAQLQKLGSDPRRAGELADLQERVRVAEQRLTAIAEETIQAKVGVVDERALNAALSLFTPVWETLSPREQSRIIRLLVERVDYDGKKGTLAVTFRPSGIQSLAQREVAA